MAATFLTDQDPDYKPYADLFRNPKGIGAGVPVQFRRGPEHFRGEFYLLYQISKEDEKGEHFDFRVFYRDINGLVIKRWINEFNKYFCAKVIDRFKKDAPILSVSQHEALPPLRNQIDFLIIGVPGRYIEEVVDRFFALLKEKT